MARAKKKEPEKEVKKTEKVTKKKEEKVEAPKGKKGDPAISSEDIITPDKVKLKSDFAKRAGRDIARRFKNKRGSIMLEDGEYKGGLSDHKKAAAEFINSRTQNQPMKVVVDGLEPVRKPEGGYIMMPRAEYHGWKIIIPRNEFITPDMVKGPGTKEEEIIKRLNGSFDAEIDIIPTKFIPENKIVVASRLKAMEQNRIDMWYAKNIKDGKEEYLIKEGSRVEARIVFVVKGGITVEANGVESFIPIDDIAYTRMDNCRAKYKAGDKTFIRIKEVTRKRDGTVSFIATVKEAYPDPRERLYSQHVIGGQYAGKVTFIETNMDYPSSAYVLLKSGMEVKCAYPKKVLPEKGDTVVVAITKKDPDKLRLNGTILHVDRQE